METLPEKKERIKLELENRLARVLSGRVDIPISTILLLEIFSEELFKIEKPLEHLPKPSIPVDVVNRYNIDMMELSEDHKISLCKYMGWTIKDPNGKLCAYKTDDHLGFRLTTINLSWFTTFYYDDLIILLLHDEIKEMSERELQYSGTDGESLESTKFNQKKTELYFIATVLLKGKI